jgi:clan AA aspartic protease (TIGR02281 family)
MYAYLGLGEKEKAIAFEDSVLAHSSSCGNLYDAACLYCRMGYEDKAMEYLRQCLEKGFTRFSHIMLDDDLNALKDRDDFKALIKEYEDKAKKAQEADTKPETPFETFSSNVSEIPFTRKDGVCEVKCKINGLPLSFVFDTGASVVSISNIEASFMFKNGYLKPTDVIGSAHFSDANGDISEGTVIMLKKVTFGNEELTNVKASVVHNQRAPLLLGQTVLNRLGTVEIDNKNSVIRIRK